MRLIDADALKPHDQLEPMGNGKYEYVEVVYKNDIDDAPTIDAVPVVRCENCIHYESDGGAMMICNVTDMVCDYDEYCSYGECREDGEA